MKNLLLKGGSLRLRRRVRGPARWEFRYWTTASTGGRKLKSVFVGTKDEYANEDAVRAKLSELQLPINSASSYGGHATVNTLIDRFIREERLSEIRAGIVSDPGALHYSTACSYLTVISKYLRPRWGETKLTAVRPIAVQEWLNSLTIAPKTKAHVKGLLRRLLEKAMLWELLQIQRNPMELVEIKGVSKRRKPPTILTVDQFHSILQQLTQPYRTMVLVAQCMGLRVSEILGLQWQDLDFDRASIQVSRGIVNGRVGQAKTEYSQDLLPMDPGLADALLTWRKEASPTPDNWVFPNPKTLRPYHACSIEKRHLQRIAKKLEIRLCWHTYRSWLDATGAPIGVQQKLMRHANVSTTMNIYGNALMDSKRDANSKVVRMALDGKRTS